jgi:hypothetical protein
MGGKELVRQPAHLRKPRKISERNSDAIGPGSLGYEPARRLGPGPVATGHDDPHAGAGETERRIEPDPGARPGDDRDRLA